MNEQNTKLLQSSFPTVYPTNLYFQCGDGWLELLIDIGSFISRKTNQCKVVEAKQKFGTLRTYIQFEHNELGIINIEESIVNQIYDFIDSVESKSKSTCEECGTDLTSGNKAPRTGYWIRNICISCSANLKKPWQK